jgi:tetratricopeptide (TPR) repeat protein
MRPTFVILMTLIPFLCRAQLDDQSSRRLMVARDAEKKRDYAAAAMEYEAILKEQPGIAVIHQSLAITYHLQNRSPEAIAEFQKALRLDASLWGSDLFLGMDFYKTNRFSDAKVPLERSIALNAKMAEPDARYWLGMTAMALEQPDDAVSDLNRDLELKPGDPDVLYYLIKAYDETSDSAFRKIGKLEPEAGAVHFLQAERFLDENRRDLAALQFSTAVGLRPDFEGWLDLPVSQSNAKLIRDPQDDAVVAAWTKLKADSSAHPRMRANPDR